jgi:two-component system phosphate regulon sensor histidine kinase PhoR
MFNSIRWRVAVFFVLLVIVCIGGLSIYLSQFIKTNYIDTLENQLIKQAYLVSDLSAGYLSDTTTTDIDPLAKSLGTQINARITIIDGNGVVLGDSEENPTSMENHTERPEVMEALLQGKGSNIRYSSTLGYNMLYTAVPIVIEGQVAGVARVSIPLDDIEISLGKIYRTIAIGSAIAAVIAILLALQIANTTITPLKRLTSTAGKIADGKLDEEIRISSRDEVGTLAKAFNQMMYRLRELVTLITEERDRLEVILSTMNDGIIVVQPDKKVTMINQAAKRMLAISDNKISGYTFIETVLDYELNNIVQRCLDSEEQQTGFIEKKPSKLTLSIIATPLSGDGGCLVLIQDLTEIRRLETIRRDFVSNVSHELRTPLSSLKALSETLREGALDDPAVAKDFLLRINTEVDKLAQMVEELSELSRIESGEAPLVKKPFNIKTVIEQATGRLKAQANRAGLRMETIIPPGPIQGFGDERSIEQVLINLIHNAIKFSKPDSTITISVEPEGNSIQFRIADDGIGIPADDLPRIFERFYKVDKARTGSGTGLGLAIARKIVEAHDGSIRAESIEGKGATFIFKIPSADNH